MTDTAAARAYPPDPGDDPAARPEAIPPAAHAHALGAATTPAVSTSSTAVLESTPPLGFPGESGTSPRALGGGEPGGEPPAFGFNAPGRTAEPPPADSPEEDRRELTAAPERPDFTRPSVFSAPAPAASPPAFGGTGLRRDRRDYLEPRDLMPSAATAPEPRRLGDNPTPTFGPPGKERSVAAMVALSIVTLGFYAVGWHRRVNQEMGDFDPRIHVEPGRSAWAVALPLLAGLLVTAAAAARILLDHAGVQLDVPVTVAQAWIALAAVGAVPYLMMVIPFSMVAMAMTAERVRVVEDHAGLGTHEQLRPAALMGWLIVPVIGGFVVMGRQQRCLNRIWHLARA